MFHGSRPQGYPDAKVLFFTAHSARLFRQTRILDENAAFLQKPVGIRPETPD
jgi:hypothetical protein